MRNIPQAAIDIVKEFEGCKLTVYLDSAALPTIGIGHLIKKGEKFTTITMQQAVELLAADLNITANAILRLVKIATNDNQYSALLSLVFNIGSGNFQSSTLRMKLNRGEIDEAANEFPRWCKAAGRTISGLLRRRLAEQKLFLG